MITETQIQVAGLYQGVLGRLPDSSGFAAYVSTAQTSGVSAVIENMIGSPEFDGYYGSPEPSNEAWSTSFVESLYYNFLAREADAGGLEAYTASLVNGTSTVAGVVESFLSSAEFVAKSETAITNWYTNYELYTEAELNPDTLLTADSLAQNVGDPSVNAGIRGVYGLVTQVSDAVDVSKLAPRAMCLLLIRCQAIHRYHWLGWLVVTHRQVVSLIARCIRRHYRSRVRWS